MFFSCCLQILFVGWVVCFCKFLEPLKQFKTIFNHFSWHIENSLNVLCVRELFSSEVFTAQATLFSKRKSRVNSIRWTIQRNNAFGFFSLGKVSGHAIKIQSKEVNLREEYFPK